MTYVLNKRERDALRELERETSFEGGNFIYKGKLSRGVGVKTLEKLVELGLAEKGPIERYLGETGYRTTKNAEICMYGATWEEILALPEGQQIEPLRVWSWPPSSTQPIEHKTRRKLPMLAPRVGTLEPRLKAADKTPTKGGKV